MTQLPESLFKQSMWDQQKNLIWMSSTLQLHRNLTLYKFPSKMSPAERIGSLKNLVETVGKIPLLQPLTFFQANELEPIDKELLFEHFQCTQAFQETYEGQGFAFNPLGNCLLLFHQANHLQLHLVDTTNALMEAWTFLTQLEESIGKSHPYAFSSRFGYLTAHPFTCGTGLEARLFFHVPALQHTNALGELLYKWGDEQMVFSGLEGSIDHLVGDFLVLKNRYTLGISEEALLSSLQVTGLKIVAAEEKARQELRQKPSAELKDFVGRSFGLLIHSYQIHPKEALSGLSGLKLGVDLGWVSGITSQKLSTLMHELRRGHLSRLLNVKSMSTQDLSHQRAEWLHRELKGITIQED